MSDLAAAGKLAAFVDAASTLAVAREEHHVVPAPLAQHGTAARVSGVERCATEASPDVVDLALGAGETRET